MTNVFFPCISFWLQEMQFYLVVLCIYRFGGIKDAGGYHYQKIVSLRTTQSNMARL